MKIRLFYVYILTDTHHTVFYTGVTKDLNRRCFEHKNKVTKGFTSKYNIDKLIYYEVFDFADSAISREKQLKKYSRLRKTEIIIKFNKGWKELYLNGKVLNPEILV